MILISISGRLLAPTANSKTPANTTMNLILHSVLFLLPYFKITCIYISCCGMKITMIFSATSKSKEVPPPT